MIDGLKALKMTCEKTCEVNKKKKDNGGRLRM